MWNKGQITKQKTVGAEMKDDEEQTEREVKEI